MQLTPRQLVTQFAHMLQEDLFPVLETVTGPVNGQMRLLASVVALAPLGRLLSARRASTGRPAKDRTALATAFMAKAVLNLPTTRGLIGRLRVDEALRQFCGWSTVRALPHESKFSRAFAEFSGSELPQQLHEAVIAATQKERLIGHIARDSTAIPARERYPETKKQQAAKEKAKQQGTKQQGKVKKQGGKRGRKKGSKGGFLQVKAADRGTRIERQHHQKLDRQLKELPRQCDTGAKKNTKGHEQYWRGYKLHLDVADGQIPISAILTSASVNDSQVAIPLMTMTSARVTHLYELMDSAYDAEQILEHSRQLTMYRSPSRIREGARRSHRKCRRYSPTNRRRN